MNDSNRERLITAARLLRPRYLLPDAASQSRIGIVLRRLEELAVAPVDRVPSGIRTRDVQLGKQITD
jgi:hypothetical protein